MFRHSAVSTVEPDHVIEAWDRLPLDIHPAYIGSGILALGLDATGLQGADFHTGKYRDTFSYDSIGWLEYCMLYLYRDRVLSRHHGIDHAMVGFEKEPGFQSMPQGWLDYELAVDGEVYDTQRILAEGRAWRREMQPTKGRVETSFELAGIRLTWTVGMGLDAEELPIRFRAASNDGSVRSLQVTITFHHHLKDGRPIARGGVGVEESPEGIRRTWHATGDTSTADVYEDADLSYGWAAGPGMELSAESDRLVVRMADEADAWDWTCLLLTGCSRDGSHTAESFRSRARARTSAAQQAEQSWSDYFASAFRLRIGDNELEYLVLITQYLLRAGGQWKHGLPLGTLFTTKFGARTFWDTFFAADGMLRCGHVREVRDICGWICRTMQPQGRPHCWMSYYDGGQPTNPVYDIAWHVTQAFSGICIRLYETTRDREDLEQRVYPYLRRVAEFAFDELFDLDDSGWYLRGTTAHDVGTERNEARKEKDLLAWLTVSVAKFADYAAVIGEQDPLVEKACSVRDWFRAHPIAVDHGGWTPWLPYMALPGPLMDGEAWRCAMKPVTRPENHFIVPLSDKPWDSFSTAASLLDQGYPEEAWLWMEGARMGVVGPGYWLESSYEHQCGGFTPYIPSGGSFLSCMTMMIVSSGLWRDELEIGTRLPRRLLSERMQWQHIRTFKGAVVSGSIAPDRLDVELTLDRPTEVTLRVPYRIAGGRLALHVNGGKVETFAQDRSRETITLELESGHHHLELTSDVRTPAEYREVHVSIARNVPLDSLNPESVMQGRNGSADKPLYVICRSGNRYLGLGAVAGAREHRE